MPHGKAHVELVRPALVEGDRGRLDLLVALLFLVEEGFLDFVGFFSRGELRSSTSMYSWAVGSVCLVVFRRFT